MRGPLVLDVKGNGSVVFTGEHMGPVVHCETTYSAGLEFPINTQNLHRSEYKSNTCTPSARYAIGMAHLCIYLRRLPLVCTMCSVPLTRHRGRRRLVCVADRGLRLGRLGHGQKKGRPRASRLHQLRFVR